MKKILPLLLLTLTLVTLLAACGNGDTTTETTTTTTTTSAAVTEDPRLAGAYDHPESFVTLPALKDIVVQNGDVNAKVEAEVFALLPKLGKTDYKALPAGSAAVKGNAVNINYVGRAKDPSVQLSEDNLNGMSNAEDTAGYNLVLGSGSFINGFEDQLIGAKKGDKIDVDVSFPENYGNEELNGLAVIFEVTVNEVYEAKASAANEVDVNVVYELIDKEPTSKMTSFLYSHTSAVDMRDLTKKFDTYFDAELLYDALLGKGLLEEITLTLTLDKESAAEFDYDEEVSLKATLTITDILVFPTELTDEDINDYSGGLYKTAREFRDYLFDYYKVEVVYDRINELAVFADIPTAVFEALYEHYYDGKIKELIGDPTTMTESELAEALTDEVKATADEFARTNATAEWKDTMIVAYLEKTTGFTFTDEMYQEKLEELYEYYQTYEYMLLYYHGIDTIDKFEAAFGADYLAQQFKNDSLLTAIAETVTYAD